MAKILIVSADLNFATLLEARLLMEDHHVFIAGDGALGFERARELQPQLMILDAALPKMSGYQLVERLKTPGSILRFIPIIVVSERARMEHMFHDTDIFHFFSKPVIPAQFLKQVDAAVKSSKALPVPEKAERRSAAEKTRILLAGVQEFLLGKIKNFLEEKKFDVDIGWDEDDLIRKAARTQPDRILLQFWEEASVFNAPGIVEKLKRQNAGLPARVLVFCAENISREAAMQMPHTKRIFFYESKDLLVEVERELGPAQQAVVKGNSVLSPGTHVPGPVQEKKESPLEEAVSLPVPVAEDARNNRFFRRAPVIIPAAYRLASGKGKDSSEGKIAQTINVSAGGLLILTREPLPLGQSLNVALDIYQNNQPIRMICRVVRCLPSKQTGAYEVGLIFVEIGIDERRRLTSHFDKGST